MTKKNMYWFSKARDASLNSTYPKVHIGVVFVYNNKRIIATGTNSYKTHTLQRRFDAFRDIQLCDGSCSKIHSMHAEIDGLRKIIRQIKAGEIDARRISVYVYREKKDGNLGKSKPCKACTAALIDAGIRDVYYTEDDGFCHKYLMGDNAALVTAISHMDISTEDNVREKLCI